MKVFFLISCTLLALGSFSVKAFGSCESFLKLRETEMGLSIRENLLKPHLDPKSLVELSDKLTPYTKELLERSHSLEVLTREWSIEKTQTRIDALQEIDSMALVISQKVHLIKILKKLVDAGVINGMDPESYKGLETLLSEMNDSLEKDLVTMNTRTSLLMTNFPGLWEGVKNFWTVMLGMGISFPLILNTSALLLGHGTLGDLAMAVEIPSILTFWTWGWAKIPTISNDGLNYKMDSMWTKMQIPLSSRKWRSNLPQDLKKSLEAYGVDEGDLPSLKKVMQLAPKKMIKASSQNLNYMELSRESDRFLEALQKEVVDPLLAADPEKSKEFMDIFDGLVRAMKSLEGRTLFKKLRLRNALRDAKNQVLALSQELNLWETYGIEIDKVLFDVGEAWEKSSEVDAVLESIFEFGEEKSKNPLLRLPLWRRPQILSSGYYSRPLLKDLRANLETEAVLVLGKMLDGASNLKIQFRVNGEGTSDSSSKAFNYFKDVDVVIDFSMNYHGGENKTYREFFNFVFRPLDEKTSVSPSSPEYREQFVERFRESLENFKEVLMTTDRLPQ